VDSPLFIVQRSAHQYRYRCWLSRTARSMPHAATTTLFPAANRIPSATMCTSACLGVGARQPPDARRPGVGDQWVWPTWPKPH
jgi:hypothetical protein